MRITRRVTFEPGRCVGCGTCRIACAVAHSESGELVACLEETPAVEARLRFAPPDDVPESAESKLVLLHCRHCADAACVAACKPEAMTQNEETGLVEVALDACIGCKVCIKQCPFDAVWMARGEEKAVVKCDLCVRRVLDGGGPACVASCPTGALRFEEPGGADDEMASTETTHSQDDKEHKQ